MLNIKNGVLVFDGDLHSRGFCICLITGGRISIEMRDGDANEGVDWLDRKLVAGYQPDLQCSWWFYEAISVLTCQETSGKHVFIS